ncbi:MAG: hypothetical protein ABJE66_15620 [Deltaproteobacteria bacterium]
MKSLAFAPLILSGLILPACMGGERATTGECPAGETCSTLTPQGLEFVGATMSNDLGLSGPAPTAIGGSQDIELEYNRNGGALLALDLPFTADDDGGNGIKVDHVTGSVVTVRGVAVRSNYLRITDATTGELFDRKELTGASIDSMKLVANTFDTPPVDRELAWLAGNVQVGVALFGQVQEAGGPTDERIVDQNMQLSADHANQHAWDAVDMPTAAPGTYSLAVTAGDKPTANLDVVIVDHIDSLVLDPTSPSTVEPQGVAVVCFDGLATDRFVAGLTWHFLVGGVEKDGIGNCVTVGSSTATSGTLAVVGSADGMSATTSVTIAAARTNKTAAAPVRTRRTVTSPAGDRAALMSM